MNTTLQSLTYRKKILVIIVGIVILLCIVFFVWQRKASDHSEGTAAYIPQTMSEELLFTPFVPTDLPPGYAVDVASYSVNNQVLLFSATNHAKQSIVFSEQVTPKDFNSTEFYETNVTGATRLDGLAYATVFGQMKGRDQSLISITAENTWILVTTSKMIMKDDAVKIVQTLVRQ